SHAGVALEAGLEQVGILTTDQERQVVDFAGDLGGHAGGGAGAPPVAGGVERAAGVASADDAQPVLGVAREVVRVGLDVAVGRDAEVAEVLHKHAAKVTRNPVLEDVDVRVGAAERQAGAVGLAGDGVALEQAAVDAEREDAAGVVVDEV